MDGNKSWPAAVVKVGGSLFDLADLGGRLLKWLGQRPPGEALLVPGGGPVADTVREYDRLHALGEERAHWLALSALTLNARFLASLLPGAVILPHAVVARCGDYATTGGAANQLQGKIPILDPYAFARADEGQLGCLPHSWTVTSDSLAARAAQVAGAGELILLKSVSRPAKMDWTKAAERGLVDVYFPTAAGSSLVVRWVNFRHWPAV